MAHKHDDDIIYMLNDIMMLIETAHTNAELPATESFISNLPEQ